MQRLLRWMRWLDYLAAGGSLVWGLEQGVARGWLTSPWPAVGIGGGLLGLGLARWNLAQRLHDTLQRHRVPRGPLAPPTPGYPGPPPAPYTPAARRPP